MSNDAIIRCKPKLYYWLIGVFLYPVAGFVFTAVFVRPLLFLLGIDLTGRLLIKTWLCLTLLVATWAYWHDYCRLYYTLSISTLSIGRATNAVSISFSEINSIVLALPDQLPWWIRIQRFNPKDRAAYKSLIRARELTALLRLSQNHYLPLNLAYNFLDNGPQFMTEFLYRMRSKIVGHETYTDREIDALLTALSNTLIRID